MNYRKFCILFFVCLMLTSLSIASPKEPSQKEIIKKAGRTVVMILSNRGDNEALGSGVIISQSGIIATNYHVIENAKEVKIKLPSGIIYKALGIVEIDKQRDLAVIKINSAKLPSLPLGDSEKVEVGDKILAIGNPLAFENTITEGIISGIRMMDGCKVFQITAPISPGSSGGALINNRGELIALTCFYIKDGQNLNFAIPINYLKPMIRQKVSIKFEELSQSSDNKNLDTKFIQNFLDVSKNLLEAVSYLNLGIDETTRTKQFEPSQLIYRAKSKIDTMMNYYNLKEFPENDDFEKKMKVKLVDMAFKLSEATNSLINANKDDKSINMAISNVLELKDNIVELAYDFLTSPEVSENSKNELISLLRKYSSNAPKGNFYLGYLTKLIDDNTLFVVCVTPNSPADKAGLKEFDKIIVNGKMLKPEEFTAELKELYTNNMKLYLNVMRNEQKKNIIISPERFGVNKLDRINIFGVGEFTNSSAVKGWDDCARNLIVSNLTDQEGMIVKYVKTRKDFDSNSLKTNSAQYDFDYLITGDVKTVYAHDGYYAYGYGQKNYAGFSGGSYSYVMAKVNFKVYRGKTGEVVYEKTIDESSEAQGNQDSIQMLFEKIVDKFTKELKENSKSYHF